MAEHKLISLNDYEELAYRKLSKELADYVRAGAQDEITLRLNRSDFSDITVNPRIFRDVNTRNLSTTALGTPIALPIMITPAGGQMHLHSDGELATARAADAHGTIYSTPTNSGKSLESIAKETTGPKWFQMVQNG